MILLVLLLGWSAVWGVALAHGPASSDDTLYLIAAERLAAGEPPGFADNRVARGSWMILLAAALRVIGPHIWAFCYLDVAFGVACVAAVYWLGARLVDRRAGFWAALLFSSFPPALRYNGIVFPDKFGLLLALVATGVFLVGLESQGARRWVWASLAGVLFAAAVSARELPLIALGAVCVFAVYQARPRTRGISLAVVTLAVTILAFAGEYVFHAWWTQDALYRHRASQQSFGSGGIHAVPFTWKALLFYPATLLLGWQEMGVFGWLLLAGLVFALRVRGALMLPVLWVVLVGLFLTFGSTSLTEYQPVPKQTRFLPMLTALLFVAVGGLWEYIWRAAGGVRVCLGALLAGIVCGGILAAGAGGKPLYWGDFPLAVERAVALRRAGECPALVIPEMVYGKLRFEHARMVADLPRINLRQKDAKLSAMLWPAWHQALVIPASLPELWTLAMRRQQSDVPDLAEYLHRSAEAIPLYRPPRLLDRLLAGRGVTAPNGPILVGHLYIVGRR
ncbi:MAG TPA: glycosyltransferase family 39 protein [Phycisphaerae bacterium]|nr:glycosyltransferase family 39 protein [Phycisphaerae bacterium]